ncbi:MBL fold metallo-hydrolase [uncultured Georgenia sp.]|uniref:MBL fold metallo-hydrolase n=1 Tax=uncultured Georgenia sp. TaxID=378209 RepID=UPI00263843C4|nr:MBL fold metallo-hydrolase [uncultured Georgenia sp.]HLV04029.1 MBL fold metallo-hydrolase [Actinomycetaceae bacterium]
MSTATARLQECADHTVCATCAVEYGTGPLPDLCIICADERQWVPRSGQAWTTVGELAAAGHTTVVTELEPGIVGIGTAPPVGIGQTGKLAVTDGGNVLFDVPGHIDQTAVEAIASRGGLAAIVASHPHMYGVQSRYSRVFDDAPVLVARADADFLPLRVPAVQPWDEPHEVVPGVWLEQVGGHFPGSTVAHLTGADGAGVLLAGDAIFPGPEGHTVSFLRSYPNRIPLSAAVVRRIADQVGRLAFDRLYNNFLGIVPENAGEVVQRSARRYVEWVSGVHDDLT